MRAVAATDTLQTCSHGRQLGAQACTNTTAHLSGVCFHHRDTTVVAVPAQLTMWDTGLKEAHPTPTAVWPSTDATNAEVRRQDVIAGLWSSATVASAIVSSSTLCRIIADVSAALVGTETRGDSRGWGHPFQAALTPLLAVHRDAISAEVCAAVTAAGGPQLADVTLVAYDGERAVFDLCATVTDVRGVTRVTPVDLKVITAEGSNTRYNDFGALWGVLAVATDGADAIQGGRGRLSATSALIDLAAGRTALQAGQDLWALVVRRDHDTGEVAEVYLQSVFGAVCGDGRLAVSPNTTRTQSVNMTRTHLVVGPGDDPEALLVSALVGGVDDDRLSILLIAAARDLAIADGGSFTRADQRRVTRLVSSLSATQIVSALLAADTAETTARAGIAEDDTGDVGRGVALLGAGENSVKCPPGPVGRDWDDAAGRAHDLLDALAA